MGDSEHKIQNECMMRVSALDNALFYRQNTGRAWQSNIKPIAFQRGAHLVYPNGKSVYLSQAGQVMLNPRVVQFGLEGAGDYIGSWRGLPMQLEFKRDEKQALRKSQSNFAPMWREAGGVYLKIWDVDQCMLEFERVANHFIL